MKKNIVLSITMLASLAGCKPQKKAKQVSPQLDVFTAVDLPFMIENNEMQDGEVLSFFDEDLGEFSFADDAQETALDFGGETDDSPETSFSTISWTDTAQGENELEKIYFEFNKYGIKPDQRKVVEADAKHIKAFIDDLDENSVILIEGHACHSSGSSAYNLALSEKRAKYVRDLLVTHGIDPEDIRIVGRGQDIPAIINGQPVTGDRVQQWANRRVEIRFVDVA
jgi:outer membrane protein OmpA-like peptidoglycan-associated protein